MTASQPAARRVWLGLGGNLGDRQRQLTRALDRLVEGGVVIDAVSSLYETPPWGVLEQPRFANAAASGRTVLTPHGLLYLCKRIEAAAGRDFAAARNTARPVDVDILLVEGVQVSAFDLVVPHAALHERAFVLVPLSEIAPAEAHPRLERSVGELLADLAQADRAGIEVLAEPGWWQPGEVQGRRP